MALKFCDTPQVHYGKQPGRDADWRERFPPKAQPIATASQTGGPQYVFEANGQQHLAHYRSGAWRKLDNVVVDSRDGTRALRETGETVNNPVAWEPPGK
jgi:hypothetical protein